LYILYNIPVVNVRSYIRNCSCKYFLFTCSWYSAWWWLPS